MFPPVILHLIEAGRLHTCTIYKGIAFSFFFFFAFPPISTSLSSLSLVLTLWIALLFFKIELNSIKSNQMYFDVKAPISTLK